MYQTSKVRKRKNHTTLTDRILNGIFRMRTLYWLGAVALFLAYPSSMIDGMRNNETEPVVRIPMKYNTHGIDISHHNGRIDWEEVMSKDLENPRVKFCFLKATEGTDLIDEEFSTHWSDLSKHQVKRGAYHFFNPSTDPRLQALNFILNVKLNKGDFAPVLDWETLGPVSHRKDLVQNVQIWLDIIEKHYGIKPIIYTNKPIYQKYIKEFFPNYPLWISHYNVPELEGYEMDNIFFWQYSMEGKLPGIASDVDFNVFIRDDFEIERITLRQ